MDVNWLTFLKSKFLRRTIISQDENESEITRQQGSVPCSRDYPPCFGSDLHKANQQLTPEWMAEKC
ncbi:hypothetical protein AKJ16_DCAP18417 [Drosera capensis]